MATEEDKTNSGALITLVAVSTFAMIAVTLAVTAIARDEMSQAQEAKEGPGADQFNDLRRAQVGSLASGVPIEQSMRNVVQGLARDPGSATPPAPVTTAAATPVATDGATAAGGAAGAAAAGGAPATVQSPAPANVATTGTPVAPVKPAAEPKAKPVAPSANPSVPPAKPLAPQPVPGQPSPAAPPTPPHG